MKILQVIPFFNPSFGGSVMIPYHLSNWLTKEGHEVTIITTDYYYDPDYANSLENVEVIAFHVMANFGLFLYSPDIKRWLQSNISKYNVVHLHNFRSYQNNIICKYAKKYNVPYVVQPHGSLLRIVEKAGLKWIYDVLWGKEILNHAKKIIAVSHCEVDQFRQAGIPDEKITIIPNGINYSSKNLFLQPGEFKERYDIKEKRVILYLGRIHKSKGIDFLIRAFKLFIQRGDREETILIIVGPNDNYLEELERLVNNLQISKRVKFIEYISNVDVAYQDADVLIYPCSFEIFGLVPFEAILQGIPVIVTKNCGCGEIINMMKCGYLVEYGDEIGLSNKIGYVLEHPKENEMRILRGQEYILENLLWEKVVILVEEMYEDTINYKG